MHNVLLRRYNYHLVIKMVKIKESTAYIKTQVVVVSAYNQLIKQEEKDVETPKALRGPTW